MWSCPLNYALSFEGGSYFPKINKKSPWKTHLGKAKIMSGNLFILWVQVVVWVQSSCFLNCHCYLMGTKVGLSSLLSATKWEQEEGKAGVWSVCSPSVTVSSQRTCEGKASFEDYILTTAVSHQERRFKCSLKENRIEWKESGKSKEFLSFLPCYFSNLNSTVSVGFEIQ